MSTKTVRSESKVEVRLLDDNRDINANIETIVDIHMQAFHNFFLTFLGKGFLKCMYKGFCTHEKSNLLCAYDHGNIVGFIAYSEDISGFYKYLIKKKLIPFAWYSFAAFLKNPKIMMRLLRAFLYPSETKRDENYVELSSIGVQPICEGMGIGSKLIDYLKSIVDFDRYDYIKLETDAQNNDSVNRFYQNNGFVLYKEYSTPEGRLMNEYRYRK